MVVIRLSLRGSKKRPFYHLVVADKRAPRDGRHLERVGFFNPIARGAEVRLQVNQERVDYWLSHGAQMSDRARRLIKQAQKQQFAAEQVPVVNEPAKKTAKKSVSTTEEPAKEPAEEATEVPVAEATAD